MKIFSAWLLVCAGFALGTSHFMASALALAGADFFDLVF